MESAVKASLAKNEVGIREKKPIPTLKAFLQGEFKQHVETTFMEKATTRAYYSWGIGALSEYRPLAECRLNEIRDDRVEKFKQDQRESGFEFSTINRKLAILRRALKLALKRGVMKEPLKIELLPASQENRRERVLPEHEREAYLMGARAVGEVILASYRRALEGIRATQRDQEPVEPRDPYLIYDLGVILMETALRPEEAYRLRWEHVTEDGLFNPYGKTKAARRTVPLSPRARAVLEHRREAAGGDWVFPTQTKSGHIEQSTVRRRHAQACKLADLEYFEPYIFRHTTLTEWARHLDFYTLKTVAGHAHHSTTERYVHRSGASTQREMRRMWTAQENGPEVQGGHKSGHTGATDSNQSPAVRPVN
ncbi:MAG: tyrosine-type recombinase/integrase [Bryobacteraceae bacterium]